jgi:hypothetical protein
MLNQENKQQSEIQELEGGVSEMKTKSYRRGYLNKIELINIREVLLLDNHRSENKNVN